MSGKFNGVQAKIKNKFPYAIYTHCIAHKINLVVIDMCKYVKVNCNLLKVYVLAVLPIYFFYIGD